MSTTEDAAHESDVPRQPLSDRFLWYVVHLLRIDQKAAEAVQEWLEGQREEAEK
jgi:hypothetical protein